MKGQQDKERRRKYRYWAGGGALLTAAAVIAASCSLTAAGKEKNIASQESTETAEDILAGADIRIKDRSQRYPLTDEKPKSGKDDWIELSLLEAAGDKSGLPRQNGKKQVTCYIKKQTGSKGGFSSPACSYDMPVNWAYGSRSGEPCLDVVWPGGSDAEVCLHITENRMFADGVGRDWKEMQKQIRESAEKTEGVTFTDFRFERYRRASDDRELLCYSFLCSTEEEKVRYAIAYVTGERYLAEFIGSCPISGESGEFVSDYAIDEITRYMAASYQETGEEKNFDQLKYRPYLGHENWPYEDLHNPFALAAEAYAPQQDMPLIGEDREFTFVSEAWEDLLRIAVGYHYDMSDEQWEAFSARPVRASDVAWITEVTMAESPIPGRDMISVGGLVPKDPVCADYGLTTLQDIAILPNLQELTLEIGSVSDYEILKHCPSLREISISSAEPLKETAWLCELPNLESLTLRISRFAYLIEMGYQKDGETTFGKEENGQTEQEAADTAGNGTLEVDLARCGSLRYLDLEQAGMMDFGFLNSLPDLYTFRLSGEEEDSDMIKIRRAAFGEGTYPQIKCLVVDDSWLRNPA